MEVSIAFIASACTMKLFFLVVEPLMSAAKLDVTRIGDIKTALLLLYEGLRCYALWKRVEKDALCGEGTKMAKTLLLSTCRCERVVLKM